MKRRLVLLVLCIFLLPLSQGGEPETGKKQPDYLAVLHDLYTMPIEKFSFDNLKVLATSGLSRRDEWRTCQMKIVHQASFERTEEEYRALQIKLAEFSRLFGDFNMALSGNIARPKKRTIVPLSEISLPHLKNLVSRQQNLNVWLIVLPEKSNGVVEGIIESFAGICEQHGLSIQLIYAKESPDWLDESVKTICFQKQESADEARYYEKIVAQLIAERHGKRILILNFDQKTNEIIDPKK